MNDMAEKISRRKLLKNTALASIAGALYLQFPFRSFAQNNSKITKVVLIRNKDVIDSENIINPGIVQSMLDEAIIELTGQKNIQDAWKILIKPTDIVGIKTNEWKYLATPPELEEALRKRIIETGVNENNISIKDRGVLSDPVFEKSTALINVRPLRTHNWSGVGSLLKNYIMFSPKPSSYHDDTCADLAKLWELPEVKGKTRLNILVVLTPLFHGVGPHHYNKDYTWQYKGLLVGTDPVAVDSVGIRILQAKRSNFFGEDRPINPPVKHVFLADTRHGLGTADPEKIELIKLGWQDEILI